MLNETTADPILKAIAEPRRREILRLLAASELTAGAVAGHFDVTQPAISQPLGVLAEVGLVAVRRDGTRRFYRATGFEPLFAHPERHALRGGECTQR